MKISLGNLQAFVTGATDEEHRWLDGYLSFEDANTAYARRAGLIKGWDGRKHLYKFKDGIGRFPSGLLGLTLKGAAREGLAVEMDDARSRNSEPEGAADTSWLDPRREQPQALAACLSATRGIVHAPTGSGKTEVISALGLVIPCNWVTLVTTKDLLRQNAERFESRSRMAGVPEDAGRIGDGVWAPKRFTVATVQTLWRSRKSPLVKAFLSGLGGVIADEAHQVAGDSFLRVMMSTPNAYWRFAFSGTPLARGDQRNLLLIAAVGDVIYRVRADALIERGVLSRPKIRFLPVRQSVPGADWQSVYQSGIVYSAWRNRVVVGTAIAAAKPGLVFVKDIAHGRWLEARLRAAKQNVEFVWGADTTDERRRAILRLQKGDLDLLVTSSVFDTGVDIPELRSIVNAAGMKSTIKTLQRLGRGSRIAEGKTEFELYDFDDRGNTWLRDHSKKRRAAYESEGFEVELLGDEASAEAASRIA